VPNPALFEVVFYIRDDSGGFHDGTQGADFCLKDIKEEEGYMSFLRVKKMNIIGNIHDNPELLNRARAEIVNGIEGLDKF
jgi:hypothetical protein